MAFNRYIHVANVAWLESFLSPSPWEVNWDLAVSAGVGMTLIS